MLIKCLRAVLAARCQLPLSIVHRTPYANYFLHDNDTSFIGSPLLRTIYMWHGSWLCMISVFSRLQWQYNGILFEFVCGGDKNREGRVLRKTSAPLRTRFLTVLIRTPHVTCSNDQLLRSTCTNYN
jgi:hypothetical protein